MSRLIHNKTYNPQGYMTRAPVNINTIKQLVVDYTSNTNVAAKKL